MARILLAVFLLAQTCQSTSSKLTWRHHKRQSTESPVILQSRPQIQSFAPYTGYAAAAYCSAARLDATLPNFELTEAGGGTAGREPAWIVGHDPSLNYKATVVIAHADKGTNSIQALVNTVLGQSSQPRLARPDTTLFPGMPDGVQVDESILNDHAASADAILRAARDTATSHLTTNVAVVGLGSGGAVALMDAIYLRLHLPSSYTVRAVTYGMPRVGNKAFADYIDNGGAGTLEVTRITNKKDSIPITPSQSDNFYHCEGEVHVNDDGNWYECLGQENVDERCAVGSVSRETTSNPDHAGPYDGITIGQSFCR